MNEVKKSSSEKKQEKKAASNNGTGFWVTLMATLGFLFASYVLYKDLEGSSSAKGVYVVDGARLAYSYIAEAEAKKNALLNGVDADYQTRLEQIETELETNLAKIQAKIEQMSGSGMVVIQRSSVLAYPKRSDITSKVAKELGITLMPEQTRPVTIPASASVPTQLPEQSGDGLTKSNKEGAELD